MARRDSGGFDFDSIDEDTPAPDSEIAATDVRATNRIN